MDLTSSSPHHQHIKDEVIHEYPEKYALNTNSQSNNTSVSIVSLFIYLLAGYLIFQNVWIIGIILLVIIIHEMGHLLAMRYFKYSDTGIFFLPLIGGFVKGYKREVSQKESAIIILAGPLPGIIIGCCIFWISQYYPDVQLEGITLYLISIIFIFFNLFNLLPVYPLDGGQLLNRVFFDEEGISNKVFVFLSITFIAAIAILTKVYILLVLVVYFFMKMFGNINLNNIENKIENSGFDLNKDYDELTNREYWEIRNILINEYPSLKNVSKAPPFVFSSIEDKIAGFINLLLSRYLIQDVTLWQKLLIAAIWITALAIPFLLDLNMRHLILLYK